jgi:glycosyltransferase involved in cell wall biosynthesis
MPAISIIVPAHNEENYIRQTLHSIKEQTFQNFEVIIVANGCTDKTEEIVKRRESEKLRLLSLPRANVSVARNAGALNAAGKLLLFLDADTQLASNSLEQIMKGMAGLTTATTYSAPTPSTAKFRLFMHGKNLMISSGIFKGFSGSLICWKGDFHSVGGYNPELTLKEHHDLRKRLPGKYGIIDTTVITSMRRFKEWSWFKTGIFWAKQWRNHYQGKQLEEYEKIR